jgi:hypothetical protein
MDPLAARRIWVDEDRRRYWEYDPKTKTCGFYVDGKLMQTVTEEEMQALNEAAGATRH